MKTDKNSQTSTTSGTLPQPEQTVSDNNQDSHVTLQSADKPAVRPAQYDWGQDPCALFELERFNLVAGIILLLLALSLIQWELFTVRPEIKQAIHRLETNHK